MGRVKHAIATWILICLVGPSVPAAARIDHGLPVLRNSLQIVGVGGAIAQSGVARVLRPESMSVDALARLQPMKPGDPLSIEQLFLLRELRMTMPRSDGSPPFVRIDVPPERPAAPLAAMPGVPRRRRDTAGATAVEGTSRITAGWPIGKGSFDKDPGIDLLMFEYDVVTDEATFQTVSREYRFVARSGSDGGLIWRSAAIIPRGYLYRTVADVDGDGILDVLAFDEGDRPDYSRDIAAHGFQIHQTTFAISGADGHELWRRDDEGRVDFVSPPFPFSHVRSVTNFVTAVRPLDRDPSSPGAEVVLGTTDFVDAEVFLTHAVDPRGTEVALARCTSTGHVLDGGTGAERWTIEAVDRSACGTFQPVGDTNDDGFTDIALFTGLELEVWSADGASRYWNRPLTNPDNSYAWIEGMPLTAAGADDLLLSGWNFYQLPGGDGSIILWDKLDHAAGFDGRSGEPLFDRHFDFVFLHAGSVDEDGGNDLYDVELSSDGHTLGFTALSGANDGVVWGPRRIVTSGDEQPYVTSFSDVDGNGSIDILMAVSEFDDDNHIASTDLAMWSGSTGGDLWTRNDVTEGSSIPGRLFDAVEAKGADADGDGKNDLQLIRRAPEGTYATAVNGLTLDPIWTMFVPAEGSSAVWGVADLTPSPGTELLVLRYLDPSPDHSDVRFEVYDESGLLWARAVSEDFEE